MLRLHGLNMSGRWIGLGYDERIMTGWGAPEESEEAMRKLISSEGVLCVDG